MAQDTNIRKVNKFEFIFLPIQSNGVGSFVVLCQITSKSKYICIYKLVAVIGTGKIGANK